MSLPAKYNPLGIPLSDLVLSFPKVSDPISYHPALHIEDFARKIVPSRGMITSYGSDEVYEKVLKGLVKGNYHEACSYLGSFDPRILIKRLNILEHSMVEFSMIYSKERELEAFYEESLFPHLAMKIRLSGWQYGEKIDWNSFVEMYDAMRSFSLGEDFEVHLDFASWRNHSGYSQFSRTYLDSSFAYLLLHQGKHVATIGFNLTLDSERKKVLQVCQIQLKNRNGNRWLFKTFGSSYFERILEKLLLHYENFGFTVKLININKILLKTEEGYRETMRREASVAADLRMDMNIDLQNSPSSLAIAHFLKDKERIRKTYRQKMSKVKRVGKYDRYGFIKLEFRKNDRLQLQREDSCQHSQSN